MTHAAIDNVINYNGSLTYVNHTTTEAPEDYSDVLNGTFLKYRIPE